MELNCCISAVQHERELLDSAREFGEKESETIIKGVEEKLPPPMVMQQDKQKVCRPGHHFPVAQTL